MFLLVGSAVRANKNISEERNHQKERNNQTSGTMVVEL